MGNVCNITVKCGFYYLPVSMNGIDLSALIDVGDMHSFVSS